MRPNVSKFKIYEESTKHNKYWANYADENVLLVTHPKVKPWTDLTDPIMQYVSSAMPSMAAKRTPLQDFLQGSGRVRYVDTDDVTWRLAGTGEVKAVQMENLLPGVVAPGIQNTEFPIKLDTEWYVEGDRLAPDVAKECQVIVKGLPVSDGTGFIYTVQLVDRDGQSFFPPELLEPQLNWIKIDAVFSEASRGYGSTQFMGNSYLEFQSNLTDYGKQVEVTNKAHNLNLKMTFCDDKGQEIKNYPSQIISYVEAEFLAQAKWEKELNLYYGRSAGQQLIDPTVGYHRRIGPGLLEFLEDGNVIPYPVTGGSLDMFTDFLQAIWFDRVAYGNRNIVIYTGQGGLTLFNQWVREVYAESAIKKPFDKFVSSGKSFHSTAPGYRLQSPQFMEVELFPWGSLRVEHWPQLDSTYLNGAVLHPETGLPLSSYEFIVLDHGLGNGGGSNIELIKRRDSEVFQYDCGAWSPTGPRNGRKDNWNGSGPQRSYILYHADTFGLRVKDVTLTAHFIPAVSF